MFIRTCLHNHKNQKWDKNSAYAQCVVTIESCHPCKKSFLVKAINISLHFLSFFNLDQIKMHDVSRFRNAIYASLYQLMFNYCISFEAEALLVPPPPTCTTPQANLGLQELPIRTRSSGSDLCQWYS